MSLFSTFLEKLGLKPKAANAAEAEAAAPEAAAEAPAAEAPAAEAAAEAAAPVTVDVVAVCEELAAKSPVKLNWKTSIVDLMKLLGMDSSFANRKALAEELGCPAELMADSASMNIWLHKAVMQKVAENGGAVPAELLD